MPPYRLNFQVFAEFYRVSDCKRFLETSDRLGRQVVSDENVQISFEGVQLYDIDREALFFSSNELVEDPVILKGVKTQLAVLKVNLT